MRRRGRERVERHAREALSLVEPSVSKRLQVIWCRRLPHDDVYHTHAVADDHVPWIFIDEHVFDASTPDEREDTVRHELAHLIAYHRHGRHIQDHGDEYRRARREIDRALDEEDA